MFRDTHHLAQFNADYVYKGVAITVRYLSTSVYYIATCSDDAIVDLTLPYDLSSAEHDARIAHFHNIIEDHHVSTAHT